MFAFSAPAPAYAAEVYAVPMYRVYNPNSGEHFYTASASERDGLVEAGWRDEGIGWAAPEKSNTPVYRLYSGTDHHYTVSVAEKDSLVKAGWRYEGIGWYSDDAKAVALLRQFNPNVRPTAKRNNSGSHNYTTSAAENASLVKAGWIAEGVGWYGRDVSGRTWVWNTKTVPVYEEQPVYETVAVYEEQPVYETRPVYETKTTYYWLTSDGKTFYNDDELAAYTKEMALAGTSVSYSRQSKTEQVQTGTKQVQTGTKKVQTGTKQVQTGTKQVQVGTKQVVDVEGHWE